jgi:hypothetical protein
VTTPGDDVERCVHEIDDVARCRVDGGRRVFLGPAVVMLGNRMQDRVPSRPGGQRHAVAHDRPREPRMIGLRDQVQGILDEADDHRGTTIMPKGWDACH